MERRPSRLAAAAAELRVPRDLPARVVRAAVELVLLETEARTALQAERIPAAAAAARRAADLALAEQAAAASSTSYFNINDESEI
jgi:hypothetical protein